jgi:hypothetical protein
MSSAKVVLLLYYNIYRNREMLAQVQEQKSDQNNKIKLSQILKNAALLHKWFLFPQLALLSRFSCQ